MEMHSWKSGDILVVQPRVKRIDSASATDFKGTMVDFINGGNMKIVLDLSCVDFVDSTGLGMIVSTLKSLGQEGVLAICGLSDIVQSLFTLTRMSRIFDISASVDEAVGKLTEIEPHAMQSA